MSLTVRSLYEETRYTYKLKSEAGFSGFYHNVSWVHFIEDTETLKFIKPNELIIVTGYTRNNDKDWLKNYIDSVYRLRTSGLIINTGKYIKPEDITEEIKDFCNEHEYPLLSMPWEIYVQEILRDYCERIINYEFQFKNISEIFRSVILDNPLHPKDETRLQRLHYPIQGSYIVSAFTVEEASGFERKKHVTESALSVLVEKYFGSADTRRLFFENDNYYILILQRQNINETMKHILGIIKIFRHEYPDSVFYAGIGHETHGITEIATGYEQACEAIRYAEHSPGGVVAFDDLGFNKMLFSVKTQELLDEYTKCLEPVMEYDRLHNSQLTATLQAYLQCDRSIQKVADLLFCHRNTVNYRIRQISGLLKLRLDDPEDIFMLTLAYKILKYKK